MSIRFLQLNLVAVTGQGTVKKLIVVKIMSALVLVSIKRVQNVLF